jgi:hypothetical protein
MTTFTTQHEQVRIQHEGMEAEVDKKIAPLILELWREGIKTLCSCQDYPGFGLWLMIPAEHEPKFRKLLRGYRGWFTAYPATLSEEDFVPDDWRHEGAHVGQRLFTFMCPPRDFAALLKHIRRVRAAS